MNAARLQDKLRSRTARVVVIGLGYAGLPMAAAIARTGMPVVGYDVDARKVDQINAGRSPVSNVQDAEVAELLEAETLSVTTNPAVLERADVSIICVPTPLTAAGDPDMSFVLSAGETIGAHMREHMLVILQSTCAPGTTRRLLSPALERTSGLRAGLDFHLAFAPERIDPGNSRFNVQNTPKLVGGISPEATRLACMLYETFIEKVVPVGSPEVAELAKLVENTFRFINISFINEMALLCDRLGVNVWEVVEAARSKPFAFMPHYPSAGVGGHCIPVVPLYLAASAYELGVSSELINAASRINQFMPRLVVEKLEGALRERGKALGDASVLIVGVAYKADVADSRESAAVRVLEEVLARGAQVTYHDPLVPELRIAGETIASTALDAPELANLDAVLLLTPHTMIDYNLIVRSAPLVIDTHSGLAPRPESHVLNIWIPRHEEVPSEEITSAPDLSLLAL